MKKFKFIGDPIDYDWETNPVHGKSYTISELNEMYQVSIFNEEVLYNWQRDWKAVIEPEYNCLHKDTDLGHFSLEIMKSIIQSPQARGETKSVPEFVTDCINISKELIKQLENERNTI